MLQNIPHSANKTQELRGLFEKTLSELYWVELTLKSMLGNAIEISSSKDLISIIAKYRFDVINHLSRLDKIFKAIGIEIKSAIYKPVEIFVSEVSNAQKDIQLGVVRDAALIAIFQKIIHYEIACYGTIKAYALALKEENMVILIEDTLEELKASDMALSNVAESHINIEAADKEI